MATENILSGEAADIAQETMMEVAEGAALAVEHAVSHYGAYYENPEFWVAVAFVLVVVLLARPISKMVGKLLGKRINDIAERINEAQKLSEDAKRLWIEYEKKFLGATNEATDIMKKAQKEIEFVKTERIKKLEDDIKIRENEAKMRIVAAEETALQEIRSMSSALSINAVKRVLSEKLDSKTQDKLIEDSINVLPKVG